VVTVVVGVPAEVATLAVVVDVRRGLLRRARVAAAAGLPLDFLEGIGQVPLAIPLVAVAEMHLPSK